MYKEIYYEGAAEGGRDGIMTKGDEYVVMVERPAIYRPDIFYFFLHDEPEEFKGKCNVHILREKIGKKLMLEDMIPPNLVREDSRLGITIKHKRPIKKRVEVVQSDYVCVCSLTLSELIMKDLTSPYARMVDEWVANRTIAYQHACMNALSPKGMTYVGADVWLMDKNHKKWIDDNFPHKKGTYQYVVNGTLYIQMGLPSALTGLLVAPNICQYASTPHKEYFRGTSFVQSYVAKCREGGPWVDLVDVKKVNSLDDKEFIRHMYTLVYGKSNMHPKDTYSVSLPRDGLNVHHLLKSYLWGDTGNIYVCVKTGEVNAMPFEEAIEVAPLIQTWEETLLLHIHMCMQDEDV